PAVCEHAPVTDGIVSDEITRIIAPAMATGVIARRSCATVRLMEKYPASRKGSASTPHKTHMDGGKKPSMMCIAPAAGNAPHKSAAHAVRRTSFFCLFVIFFLLSSGLRRITKKRRVLVLSQRTGPAFSLHPLFSPVRTHPAHRPSLVTAMHFRPKRQVFWLGRPRPQ